jgi:histidinol dehydrogenase
MKVITNPTREAWKGLCQRPQLNLEFLEGSVKNILARVKSSGDGALRELTLQFDKVAVTEIQIKQAEIKEAIDQIPPDLKTAIEQAARNIEKFHAAQTRDTVKIETMPGVVCWRKPEPIQKVGIYVPGGSAPLFSTVLMLGIPAKLAGCEEVILCSPPESGGVINPAILFAAQLSGIKNIFKVGGAQAIAAMAYGTETIPSVNKIFGPGNQYVTKAKQIVNLEGTAIDMPAGPSEVLVWADEDANASYVAADLLSQAEHGADSQVMLVASKESIANKIIDKIAAQLERLPRKDIAKEALANSRAIILDKYDAVDFVNDYAPEHLIINTKNCDELIEEIKNAGSIFLGQFTPESAGDYASGTNHTLPTNGFAKSYGGVSLESFIKYITVQKISREGITNLGPTIELMAEAEKLRGHAEAVRVRTNQSSK